jgi:hypothetical protein
LAKVTTTTCDGCEQEITEPVKVYEVTIRHVLTGKETNVDACRDCILIFQGKISEEMAKAYLARRGKA